MRFHDDGRPSQGAWVESILDCSFLAIITVLSSLPYIDGLGFYSDDWAFLKVFQFASHRSLAGLVRAFFLANPDTLARPVQAFYVALLYELFGPKPLGYHVANTLIFFLGLCAFYFAARA